MRTMRAESSRARTRGKLFRAELSSLLSRQTSAQREQARTIAPHHMLLYSRARAMDKYNTLKWQKQAGGVRAEGNVSECEWR